MSACFSLPSNVPKTSLGSRRFHDIPVQESKEKYENTNHQNVQSLLSFIDGDIIGKESTLNGPYGKRKVVYCDFIASGRALQSIEDYILENILPLYGNTHTTTTVTSLQSSMFLQESRMMIRNSVRADEHDAVIFVGNGVTGAVDKLINALNLDKPPVVFVGPHEHHSNLLPWREVAAKVIRICEDENGHINLKHLEAALSEWKVTGLQMIGCFSAASNITGIIADTAAVSSLLHKYGALAFWDYATAGPYVAINMHPPGDTNASKDAIFLSMHKFVGGVDAPGVLVVKRSLLRSEVPTNGGGGSVFFVSRGGHRYLQDEEAREEGGTPRVVGGVRAALAIELKDSVGAKTILNREESLYKRALKVWEEQTNLQLLGKRSETTNDQLAVFSFMIYCPQTKNHLHHNYVAALLNDLFGIQGRGGCACAGPYAQDLMGISEDKAFEFEQALLEDSQLNRIHLRRQGEYSQHEVLRPGFIRINLSYFCSDEEADFIIEAVSMVARHGWKLLPQYMFNPETGEWRHTKHKVFADRKWLGHARFTQDGLKVKNVINSESKTAPSFREVLELAEQHFKNPLKGFESKLPDHRLMFDDETSHLRWFLLPSEAQLMLQGNSLITAPPPNVLSVRTNFNVLTEAEIRQHVKVPDLFLSKSLFKELSGSQSKMGKLWKSANLLEDSTQHNKRDTLAENTQHNNKNRKPEVSTADLESSQIIPEKSESSGPFTDTCIITSDLPQTNSCDTACETDNTIQENFCRIRLTSNPATKPTKDSTEFKFVSPPKNLFKLTAEAIEEFQMVGDGDKVLVCLSGGKDSLSLLHVLHQYKFYAKSKGIQFDLGAVTIDPMTSSFDPSPLIPYLKSLGVTYFYEEQNILEQAMESCATSICAFCSRMKRGRLYACARREGWNVLAFGQHLDDLAESFLMSAFHNGLLRTMKANYLVQEGDLRVVRPFVYVREIDTRHFAESAKLPVIPENCPACFEAPKERHRMKQLLAAQEILHPRLFNSLREAMHPLYAKNLTGLESSLKR